MGTGRSQAYTEIRSMAKGLPGREAEEARRGITRVGLRKAWYERGRAELAQRP